MVLSATTCFPRPAGAERTDFARPHSNTPNPTARLAVEATVAFVVDRSQPLLKQADVRRMLQRQTFPTFPVERNTCMSG